MFDISRRDSDAIAIVTLSNPPANALGFAQIDRLSAILDELEADERIRAVIFRSELRFFSAGADIALMAEAMRFPDGPDRMAELCRRMQAAFARLEALEIPTVAAISGICVGGGFELALSCDIRVAEKDARIGLPEVRIGLLPGAGGTQRLAALAGKGVASRLIMTGEMVGGERAMQLGIVEDVAEPGHAFEAALDIARAVVAGPRRSLVAIKRCIALARSPEGFEAEIAETRELQSEPETRGRIAAFIEKSARKQVAV